VFLITGLNGGMDCGMDYGILCAANGIIFNVF